MCVWWLWLWLCLLDDHQPSHISSAVRSVPALQRHPHQQGLCGDSNPQDHIRYKHDSHKHSSCPTGIKKTPTGSDSIRWFNRRSTCHIIACKSSVSHKSTVWGHFLFSCTMSQIQPGKLSYIFETHKKVRYVIWAVLFKWTMEKQILVLIHSYVGFQHVNPYVSFSALKLQHNVLIIWQEWLCLSLLSTDSC